jgi:hypothetical protein
LNRYINSLHQDLKLASWSLSSNSIELDFRISIGTIRIADLSFIFVSFAKLYSLSSFAKLLLHAHLD